DPRNDHRWSDRTGRSRAGRPRCALGHTPGRRLAGALRLLAAAACALCAAAVPRKSQENHKLSHISSRFSVLGSCPYGRDLRARRGVGGAPVLVPLVARAALADVLAMGGGGRRGPEPGVSLAPRARWAAAGPGDRRLRGVDPR